MKMTFRWYGESDPVSVRYISQIPTVTGVVSAVYDVPPGEVWSVESIKRVRSAAEKAGLEFEVVESVPVHEDIKLGKPTRDKYIEVYKENIRRLGKAGIKCICYNFMPVFDWLRSRLDFENPDGSTSLVYRESDLQNMDPRSGELSLPGWDNAKTAIAQYVGSKKGYKKNKYQYADRTRQLVEENWGDVLDQWGYRI